MLHSLAFVFPFKNLLADALRGAFWGMSLRLQWPKAAPLFLFWACQQSSKCQMPANHIQSKLACGANALSFCHEGASGLLQRQDCGQSRVGQQAEAVFESETH